MLFGTMFAELGILKEVVDFGFAADEAILKNVFDERKS